MEKQIELAKLILESNGYIVLREMAMERHDVIDRCISLGKRFVEHFKEIYSEPSSQVVSHWCDEMNAWYHDVSNLVLKPKSKQITIDQLVDWFFTTGSSLEILFTDSTESDYYNELIKDLLKTDDVKISLVNIGLINESVLRSKKQKSKKSKTK